MPPLLGERPLTPAEAAATIERWLGGYAEREIDPDIANFVATGVTCENDAALRAIAGFLTALPAEIARLEAEIGALRSRLTEDADAPSHRAGTASAIEAGNGAERRARA